MVFTNVTFENCSTADMGGAVLISKSQPGVTVTFKSCVFRHNSAAVAGGAVAVLSSEVMFDDCIFVGNRVASSLSTSLTTVESTLGGLPAGRGGAVAVEPSLLCTSSCGAVVPVSESK